VKKRESRGNKRKGNNRERQKQLGEREIERRGRGKKGREENQFLTNLISTKSASIGAQITPK
jgi:hypothetical protein